jgi:hypothetical protein
MRILRAIAVLFGLLFAAGAHADTFTIAITSSTAAFPGHLAAHFGDIGSGTVDLTANVPALFPVSQISGFVEGQIFPTSPASVNFVETIAVNGVSTNVTSTESLILNPDGCSLLQHRPAIKVTTDLGALGKVDVTLNAISTAGITCTNGVPDLRTILIIPGVDATVLLHDVPKSTVPEPSPASLSIAGLVCLGLYRVRRKLARSS